ncbi:MAG: peptidoglycan-binding protein [Xanthomonas sp.]
MSDNNTIYNDMVQPRGPGYRSDNIKPWSHYREPIDTNDGRLHGESRRWGDASPETQSRVIDSLMDASHKAGLSSRETAYVLAIARVESGFNPDAAAGTTSASGLGQFVDRTGAHYGVNNANRFDVETQSRALVQHYIDNRDLAQRRGQGEDHIYKYHHDGPSKDYGGLALSRREVTPYLDRYQQFVEQHQSRTQGQGQAQEQGRSQQHTAVPQPQPHGTSHSNFQQTMERMLPSQGKVDPHITGHYGEQRARGPHGGTDFNYEGGQTGINRQHPTVHAPISGTVTFSGGQYGTVKIRDAQGNSHEILHLDSRSVKEGDVVRAGDAIGTMGGRGPNGANQYAQHVHYQMHDANGKAISPETWWNRGQQVDTNSRDHAQHGNGNGNGTLRQGDQGAEVRELQQHLNRLGIRDAQGRPLAEDGRFGDNTHEAVTALQKQRGLTQDGIVGRDTRAGLVAAEQAQAKPARGPQLGEPGHPDTPLYDRMRTEADRGAEKANPPHARLSNEAVANLTLHAKQAGIDSPDQLKEVNVANDKAFVAGTTPGFRAVVDLQQAPPPLEQTSAQLARQSAQQQEAVQREQQQDANKAMARC